jgi:hypothetical protein
LNKLVLGSRCSDAVALAALGGLVPMLLLLLLWGRSVYSPTAAEALQQPLLLLA